MDIKAFRGLSGTYNVRANERDHGAPRNIECLVQFLNNTQHKFVIDRRSKGQCLLDCVFKHLNLIETDFFGLKYLPHAASTAPTKNGTLSSLGQSAPLNHNDGVNQHHATSINHSPSSETSLSNSSRQNLNDINSSNTDNSVVKNIINNNNSINSSDNHNSESSINHHSKLNNEINHTPSLVEERWLDPTKSIRKQYKSGPPFRFDFRVKFYVSDPSKLADDTTRNHLYLQLRQDILNNRLIVPPCSAILLASYILQSEVGDYKRELLEENYVSKYRLLPSQSDDIKKKIVELHKQHKSLSPADAEYNFLEHAAKKLDCYGVEFYDALDHHKDSVSIGVSSNGLVIFKDNKRTNQFSWAKIIKIMFKKKLFSIQLRREEGEICDSFIEFNLLTNQACKSFWEECVAQHSFFRLHQPKSPPKKFFSFLNFGSKFQYNGKTEYQTMEESRKRTFSHFSRTPSKRYARRTLPIGRPSWSESSNQEQHDSNTDSPANSHLHHNHHHQTSNLGLVSCDSSGADNNKLSQTNDARNNSWLLTQTSMNSIPSASRSLVSEKLLHNGSDDCRSPAYKPKSLTLKSFMYIDESKSPNSRDTKNESLALNVTVVDSNIAPEDGNRDERVPNNCKKNFKRTESLRISNPIKGAISLTKKAGASSGSQLARISESLRDKFLASKSKQRKATQSTESSNNNNAESVALDHNDESDDPETSSEVGMKIVRLSPGKDGKYGFKIRELSLGGSNGSDKGGGRTSGSKKNRDRTIIIYDVSPNSPAATCDPRLYEGDRLVTINGLSIEGMSESRVENLIKNIQCTKPPDLVLEINPRYNIECTSPDSSGSYSDANSRLSPISNISDSRPISNQTQTLAESIKAIKKSLEDKDLIEEFEKLSRKKEDESHEESRLMENIDKNRYQDILPYDSTRVQLIDSMTGDYINASFVDMVVPSGTVNRYIATQGPLSTTCDDFWQMIWEQNCSMIIMVTPLIEGGRVKCHKYWPNEKEDVRYGQLSIRNLSEKSKSATIDRSIQLLDVKSGEKRITTQIQYKAWPDHEVPEDCSDFLKLVNRVKKHRSSKPEDPIVVHCSAGIGRTGVLILMETAICTMEAGEPVYPIKILTEMRKQRAMLIQTSSQFQFVASAICRVYDQKLYSKSRKRRKK